MRVKTMLSGICKRKVQLLFLPMMRNSAPTNRTYMTSVRSPKLRPVASLTVKGTDTMADAPSPVSEFRVMPMASSTMPMR